jgi:ADP-heptose:LPS heptosyltransferase
VKILAIRLARFGDIVLLLPAITSLKSRFPDSRLTFLTDQRWAPLATMCPAIDEVIGIDRIGMRDGSLWNAIKGIGTVGREVRGRHFDVAIDFHGFRETSLLAWWSGAKRRMGLRRFDQPYWGWCFNLPSIVEDKQIHVADMFQRVADGFEPTQAAVGTPLPAMVVPQTARESARATLPPPPYVVLFVDGPVKERIWPKERFVEVARHIEDRYKVPSVLLSAASGLSIPQLAAAIGSARMLISNDTGPLHVGPALGVPTLGIFSVGFPQHFRPTGAHDTYLQANPVEAVETRSVIEAVDRLWETSAR